MACHLRVEYPGALSQLTARVNVQQTIIHDETDRADFLTGLGQEILLQRWCSANQAMTPPLSRVA